MGVFQRSFRGVEEALSPSDPMEQANQFVRDGIFTEEGVLFDCVEDDGCFEDGGVERVNAM